MALCRYVFSINSARLFQYLVPICWYLVNKRWVHCDVTSCQTLNQETWNWFWELIHTICRACMSANCLHELQFVPIMAQWTSALWIVLDSTTSTYHFPSPTKRRTIQHYNYEHPSHYWCTPGVYFQDCVHCVHLFHYLVTLCCWHSLVKQPHLHTMRTLWLLLHKSLVWSIICHYLPCFWYCFNFICILSTYFVYIFVYIY